MNIKSNCIKMLKILGLALGFYLLLPLVIFDFSSVAVPYDEENHSGRSVAIGPRPRDWVPLVARDVDIPGGADYSPDSWMFQIWKPVCVEFCKAKGYALPARWR
jgi:hypothetical protein